MWVRWQQRGSNASPIMIDNFYVRHQQWSNKPEMVSWFTIYVLLDANMLQMLKKNSFCLIKIMIT